MKVDFKTTRRNVEKHWLINHDVFDKFPFFAKKISKCLIIRFEMQKYFWINKNENKVSQKRKAYSFHFWKSN